MRELHVGVVGCGVISEVYLRNLTTRFASLRVTCCADAVPEKSEARARQFGIRSVPPERLLRDEEVDVVLNLTNPLNHAEISHGALLHGKHVYTEKPLTATLPEADELLREARQRGLRVGCAPDTFLGAGIQTACRAIADGWIGTPLSATAFFTCRGHERWHENPGFYYQPGGGPHLDMGPYYITALVAALGPVRQVSAMRSQALRERVVASGPLRGARIPVETGTHYAATLEMACGVIVTAIFSFDIWGTRLPFLEIYGTEGSLSVPDPNNFDGPVYLRGSGEQSFMELPLRNPFTENLRGIGLAQMCHAIAADEPHCADGAVGRHVLEVLCAMDEAAERGQTVPCLHPCEQPPLLPTGRLEAEYGF